MSTSSVRKYLYLFLAFWGLCLLGKYLLGPVLPFLMGALIALAAEPVVGFLAKKLPRGLSAGIGVTATLILLLGLLSFLGALVIRQLGQMADSLPDIRATAREGMTLLEDFLLNLSNRTPEGIRPLLCQTVLRLFDNGSAILDRIAARIPGMVGAFLGGLPGTALGLGTGIVAGFLISARLPKLRTLLHRTLPETLRRKYLPALQQLRHTLGHWLLAQGKLMAITYCIVTTGFFLLKIPFAPAWALLVALVDAFPLLGTGTILLPWALIALLQSRASMALGLWAIYVSALVTRTTLEPKFVGRHLGLDPLATLVFLYLGYQFWGFWGMLLAPLLAAAVKSVTH